MIPAKTIEELILKHSTLEKDLSSGAIDKKLFAEKSKEYSDLNEIIINAKKYLSYEDDKKDLEKILNDGSTDKELKDMAELELSELKTEFEINEKKLKLFLLPKDEADKKNAIIEIRAGTGGLEASLFASDLFKMYEKVSHKKKWTLELISISRSDAGGLKEVIASIKGTNIYSTLKYESGVHRVQRVPDTETQGRVHTSAATVAVLPEAEEVDLKINESDLRIDVFRAGGPGGQSVNTTDSAVRITHIPTGLSVSQQDEKSQHKNKAKGMKILRSRLYELERSRIDQERSQDRKTKIGTGDRSERIRTYNFPQGRVTDHRINLTLHRLEEFLEGEAFDIRKTLIKFDNVLNDQRHVVFSQRKNAMNSQSIFDYSDEFLKEIIDDIIKLKIQSLSNPKSNEFSNRLKQIVGKSFDESELKSLISVKDVELKEKIISKFSESRDERIKILGEDHAKEIEKRIFLQSIDLNWKSHIQYLEQLRQVIGLRSYGQRDPLVEYKKEAFDLFSNLLEKLKLDYVTILMNLKIVTEQQEERKDSMVDQIKSGKKIGRNEPCSCGSGKKFKHCCGAL